MVVTDRIKCLKCGKMADVTYSLSQDRPMICEDCQRNSRQSAEEAWIVQKRKSTLEQRVEALERAAYQEGQRPRPDYDGPIG